MCAVWRTLLTAAGFEVAVTLLASEALSPAPVIVGPSADPVADCGYGDEMLLYVVKWAAGAAFDK